MPMPAKLDPNARVSGDDYNRLIDALREVSKLIVGPGLLLSRTPGGRVLSLIHPRLDHARGSAGGTNPGPVVATFMAVITEVFPYGDGNENRWQYGFYQAEKDGRGYGEWVIVDDGYHGRAYNGAENPNSSQGVQGTGIDADNLPGTFAHQPIPPGVVVLMCLISTRSGDEEFWFTVPNGIDGACA